MNLKIPFQAIEAGFFVFLCIMRFFCCCLLLVAHATFAQHPFYYAVNDENGLPSNAVYSIVQDENGFIWLGCDAGLYKFDGIRYIPYKCAVQKSKSVTGLTLSASGKLYCYNFQSQVFYLENDTLKELVWDFPNIINMVADKSGNVLVSHLGGIARYNEVEKKWKNYFNYDSASAFGSDSFVAKVARVNRQNEIFFIHSEGVGRISNDKLQISENDFFKSESPGKFHLEYYDDALWIISLENNKVYRHFENKTAQVNNKNLLAAIFNRKVNYVRALPDGMLWICTYKGIVRYNPANDSAQLFYPELSFSDCLIDREGNYWFSTLQAGMLRVPDLNFWVWNKEHELLKNDKLSKITTDNTHIYFATASGTIGRLNIFTNELKTFHTGNDADVQSLDFDFTDGALWFNVNNHLFRLKNNHIQKTESKVQAIKSRYSVNRFCFLASSHGTFINDEKITKEWSREIEYDSINHHVWVTTNNGLLKFQFSNNKWILTDTFFAGTQMLSVDFDAETEQLYALAFNGKMYAVSAKGNKQTIGSLPENIQPYKLKYHAHKIYLATNKGIWIFDLKTKLWQSLNALSGLASNNVHDLVIVNGNIWLATSKGLQKIPVDAQYTRPLAKIYLKNNFTALLRLNYGQPLALHPEASIYSSNGNFRYAYRIRNLDTTWSELPATVEQIDIQNIPAGEFEIELKAVDHLERDSENIITISGYVSPPFWKTWWFYALISLTFVASVFFAAGKIIAHIRKREHEKTQLFQSQLTALKAQMNPHFMYNTLNSIQALILQHDIKNSNLYLSRFSHLMRKVLDVSGRDEISLQEETEILEHYLSLEKLRFGSDFTYRISVSENIDAFSIMLPPLILQPFVENAIKHGLLHKKGAKTLHIDFRKENGLICRIKDNGIGRERARQIQERINEKHLSFSTEATQKRIELLNRVNDRKFEIHIKDLYENEQPSGTEVVLKFFG